MNIIFYQDPKLPQFITVYCREYKIAHAVWWEGK